MTLYLYRLRYSTRVLRHLVQEEFEERSWMEEDQGRPVRREGCGDHKLLLHLIKSSNHVIIRGGFDLTALKVAVLVN